MGFNLKYRLIWQKFTLIETKKPEYQPQPLLLPPKKEGKKKLV